MLRMQHRNRGFATARGRLDKLDSRDYGDVLGSMRELTELIWSKH